MVGSDVVIGWVDDRSMAATLIVCCQIYKCTLCILLMLLIYAKHNCLKHANIFHFFLQDAHGNQFGQIIRDRSQDYQLIVGYQYQDTTVLRFRRKLETCDGEDLSITVNEFKMIFFSFSYKTMVN